MSARRGDVALGHEATGTSSPITCQAARSRVGRYGAALLVVAAIAVIADARLGYTINNDVAWYVYSAGAFLDGGRLYDSIFFEVNPPLMLYLTVPGVALARFSGIAPAPAYVLSVFAVVALSLWLAAAVLRRQRIGILALMLLALVILPAGDFGQRSHLMVSLALPYLLLTAIRLQGGAPCGTAIAVAVGAIAGLGVAIKPHYLLLPATLECLLWWRRHHPLSALRPETLALGAVLAAYAVAVVLFTPEYLRRVIPYALEVYNGAYRNSWSFVLARPETLLVPLAALLHLPARRSLAAPLVLLAGNLAFAAAAGRPLRLAGLALAGLLVIKAAILADNRYPLMDRLRPFIDARGAEVIYFFSSNTWTGFPMTLYADVEWASRFPALWLLPGIVNARNAAGADRATAALAEIDRFTTEAVIADLSARPPDLVFVDARPRKPWYREPGFDFISHFSADPRFAALWAEYERIGSVEGFEIYAAKPLRRLHP
jgi:hypothetical protein